MGIRWDAFYVALFSPLSTQASAGGFVGCWRISHFRVAVPCRLAVSGSVFLRGLSVFVDSRQIRGRNAVFLGVVGFFVCCSSYRVLGLDPSTTNRDDDDKKKQTTHVRLLILCIRRK